MPVIINFMKRGQFTKHLCDHVLNYFTNLSSFRKKTINYSLLSSDQAL